ncbi:MAG: recombinase family protein [Candidatus Atribacteria bacterium]|nr:recombinase family protein [Candidatus Atribacteria bacterium]
MRIKYNRVSTLQQSGDRFSIDNDNYDQVYLDKVSGSVSFNERPKGKEVAQLVNEGKVKELVVEEFSRLGRNTGDVIRTLEWLEDNEVNLVVRNIGLQSRPNGQKNPIWKMISSVMSSLYEMELENIKERTMVGRQVYLQNGGVLGRPSGTNESEKEFLKKANSQKVIKSLKKGLTIREVSKVAGVSTRTVMKVKKIAIRHGIMNK